MLQRLVEPPLPVGPAIQGGVSQLRNQLAQIVTLTDKEGKLQYAKNNAIQLHELVNSAVWFDNPGRLW